MTTIKGIVVGVVLALIVFIYFATSPQSSKNEPKDEFYNSALWVDTVNSTINGELEPMIIEKSSKDGKFYFIRRKSDNSTFSIPSLGKSFSIGEKIIVIVTHYQMNSLGVKKELFEILPFESK